MSGECSNGATGKGSGGYRSSPLPRRDGRCSRLLSCLKSPDVFLHPR